MNDFQLKKEALELDKLKKETEKIEIEIKKLDEEKTKINLEIAPSSRQFSDSVTGGLP